MSEHMRDQSVPIEYVKHVGPVARCVCGRDFVGGYACEGAKQPAPDTQPAPASGEGEALREALAEALLASWRAQGSLHPPFDTDRNDALMDADALIAGPLARLVAERDEAREKVRRVEAAFLPVIAYLDDVDAFYGDEEPDDVIDTSDGQADSPALTYAALRATRAALGGEQAGDGGMPT